MKVRITIYKDKDNSYMGFEVKGHSSYSEEGTDIVCAGISAISYAILNSLESIAGLDISSAIVKSGHMKYMIDRTRTDNIGTVDTILAVADIGFSQITQEYAEYAQIEYKEV